jgi:hypothetical protein
LECVVLLLDVSLERVVLLLDVIRTCCVVA